MVVPNKYQARGIPNRYAVLAAYMKTLSTIALAIIVSFELYTETDTDPGYEHLPHLAFAIYDELGNDRQVPEGIVSLIENHISECDYHYQHVLLEGDSNLGNLPTLYSIASSPNRVVFGKHYRFDLSTDMKNIEYITISSKGCLDVDDIPLGEKLPKASVHPNLVGEPNELHVLVSLLQRYPVVLYSVEAEWLIYANTIRNLKNE